MSSIRNPSQYDAPTLRLAFNPRPSDKDAAIRHPFRTDSRTPLDCDPPAALISFAFLKGWLELQPTYIIRNWALDSGAFSVGTRGLRIELAHYIDVAKRLLAVDPSLVEVFSLDVIGDWRATIKNTEQMWAAGVQAIPAYHRLEPWDVLTTLARDYPKIAIGGMTKLRGNERWAFMDQCFARVWRRVGPKKIHGFGTTAQTVMLRYPFHSVDATSWELKTCGYGHWDSLGGRVSVRGSKQNLRGEVEYFLHVEQKAREKWGPLMQTLP